jgi:ABC-type Fe3+ transport system substrate-binding protein
MRYVYLILFALVLGLPFALRRAAMHDDTASAAKDQKRDRLIVVTVNNGDIRREFGRAFDAWHRARYGQGVAIDFRVPGGTSDMVRFLRSEPGEVQVVWGGGDFTFYHDLQPLGLLQPMHIEPALMKAAFPNDTLAGVRLFDAGKDSFGSPAPQWIGVALSSFGIVYNPQLYQALQLPAPAAWSDLADPKLFGFVALADPAHSGSAAVSYMMVLQRSMADAEGEFLSAHSELRRLPKPELKKRPDYQAAIASGWKRGMGQLLLIAANARYFTDSSEVVPTDVGRGEAAAGMAIDFYARVTEGTVGPDRAKYIAPHASTAITPDGVAILRGVSGQPLELATHFVEFLLTPEAQRLWILQPGQPGGPIERSPRRMPIRRDVYADQTGWADHFNPFDEAGGFNQRGEWMALMSDTRPIWDAAWIDSRDGLLDAYSRILLVPDESRRRQLLERLADVPVTMKDVESRRTERTRIEETRGDIFDWTARQRIGWGNRFRDHYARIAAQTK